LARPGWWFTTTACASFLCHLKYIVISPVKDEERYVHHTLESMVRQSVKPVRWIIVDDGSSDQTAQIVRRYEQDHGFILLVQRPRGLPRQPGSAVVHAFNSGYEAAGGLDYGFIVKLDCDLSFEANYFERLLEQFRADPKLGIASGAYLENSDGLTWAEVAMPPYHAAGASKVLRRTCFEQIGGFVPARGWDTVDEIRAMTHGWRTRHFGELKMKHWKREGTGIGALRTNFMHGEVYYRTSGSKAFFLLKVAHRVTCRPLLIGGLALFWGYLRTMLRRQERLVTQEEARYYRALLNGRMAGRLKGVLQTT
jgi:poly-beta-1,6-N-acetyl-D-glucosamine synthase